MSLLEYIKSLFDAQNKTLDRQGEKLDRTVDAVSAQGQMLTHLAKQIDVLSTSHEQLRKDLPEAYMPRKEFQAMNIDARLAAAEKEIADSKLAAKDDIANHRFALDGRMIATLITAIFALLSTLVTIFLHYAH